MEISQFKDFLLTFKGVLYQNKIKKFEKYSTEQIEQYQIRKLKKLLLSSSREISYYRDLFWNIGFDPNTFSSLDDLKKIPILDKSTIRDNYSKLISGKRIKG